MFLLLVGRYRLDTDSLARGVLNGHHYGPTLSAHDCFELGRQAYNNGDYFHTTVWMDQAREEWEGNLEITSHRVDQKK